jgi:hypothetical protein
MSRPVTVVVAMVVWLALTAALTGVLLLALLPMGYERWHPALALLVAGTLSVRGTRPMVVAIDRRRTRPVTPDGPVDD